MNILKEYVNRRKSTLMYAIKDSEILLGKKKLNNNTTLYNGFGGQLLQKESFAQAAIREMTEESGITPIDVSPKGVLLFEVIKSEESKFYEEVHVFKTTKWSGEPIESDEMIPSWFNLKDLPFQEMWKDDQYWMPLFLADKLFTGYFLYEKNKIVAPFVREVSNYNPKCCDQIMNDVCQILTKFE